MRNVGKFIIALTLSAVLMAVVSAFAVTVYAVPDAGLSPQVKQGERVVVNRLERACPTKGDIIVFSRRGNTYMGKVAAVPGDTVSLRGSRYVLPRLKRCPRCGATDCRHYLVTAGKAQALVRESEITGVAHPLKQIFR